MAYVAAPEITQEALVCFQLLVDLTAKFTFFAADKRVRMSSALGSVCLQISDFLLPGLAGTEVRISRLRGA
jgi:hypothetical protein